MTIGSNAALWTSLLAGTLIFASGDAGAATKAPKASASAAPADSGPIQILPGTSSKEPVSIDADKLVYFDKEKKAIYSGNVVVVQGDTKMTCSVMTVFLDRSPTPGAAAPADPKTGPSPDANGQKGGSSPGSGVTRLEAKGPVTVLSKTQVATGDSAIYDKRENRVQLIGHVTLSDGQNVTKGDKLTYDLKTSMATIDTASKSGRVHGQYLPNGGADATKATGGGDATKPK
jgi:lipopolysaccharide export system protein LptA